LFAWLDEKRGHKRDTVGVLVWLPPRSIPKKLCGLAL
jgi:hypothetical protein